MGNSCPNRTVLYNPNTRTSFRHLLVVSKPVQVYNRSLAKSKKVVPPDLGLEPRALGLKVPRANQLCQPGSDELCCVADLMEEDQKA